MNLASYDVLTPRMAPARTSSSETIEIAEFEISPGGGTRNRQAQAMAMPAANDATAIMPCKRVISFCVIRAIAIISQQE